MTSHVAKSNDKLHSDTSSDYLANQQSSLNENDQDLVWLYLQCKPKIVLVLNLLLLQNKREPSLWGLFNPRQGCLLGLILPHVDIKKVKICIWVMSAESK